MEWNEIERKEKKTPWRTFTEHSVLFLHTKIPIQLPVSFYLRRREKMNIFGQFSCVFSVSCLETRVFDILLDDHPIALAV